MSLRPENDRPLALGGRPDSTPTQAPATTRGPHLVPSYPPAGRGIAHAEGDCRASTRQTQPDPQLQRQPPALLRLLRRQSLAPSPALRFREFRERALRRLAHVRTGPANRLTVARGTGGDASA